MASRAGCQWSGSRSPSCPAGVAGKRVSTSCRYAHGSTPSRWQVDVKLKSTAAVWPPRGEPTVNLEAEERLADRVAAFGGSWPFILVFCAVMVLWIVVNTWMLAENTFDPYPYILLNLVLSMLAAMQAPIIIISQNRQAAKDRLQADLDYRINLKAELEVAHLHKKVDRIWEEMQAQLARPKRPW